MRRIEAAQRRLPPDAVFSGLTAAWLHKIEVLPCDLIEATVPPESALYRRSGIRIRRAALPDADVVVRRGLRTTGIVRSLADICATTSLTDGVVVTDAALHARRASLSQLSEWADMHAARRGIRNFRRVIALAEPDTESPMESRLRMVLYFGGLPRPKVQVPIYDAKGRFVGRPDLYYEKARLGIEFDGAIHRTTLAEDNRRQNKLLNAGIRLLRFTAGDVHNPASVVMQVRAALAMEAPATSWQKPARKRDSVSVELQPLRGQKPTDHVDASGRPIPGVERRVDRSRAVPSGVECVLTCPAVIPPVEAVPDAELWRRGI